MFSRGATPSAPQSCKNPCKAAKAKDEVLSTATQERIQSYTGQPEPANGLLPSDDMLSLMSADSSPCKKRALTLGPTLRRFNRYREALPYARAANDMYKLGDDAGGKQSQDCLTRLPDTGEALCKELGLKPGTISDQDMRDDSTGFRAEIYRDEASARLILVARDTQPNSLVD